MILDTSLLVAAERGALRMEPWLESLGDEPVAIAAITASELLHGVHRAREAGVRARRLAFVEGLLGTLPVMSFGLPEARCHAGLWADLAASGRMIGPHDLLVGATALARGHAVATLNETEFRRVPGLRLAALWRFRRA